MMPGHWRPQARKQLGEVRALLASLDVELNTQGAEWRAAGDLDAIQAREEARAALETEEVWWESFAPPGAQW